MIHQVNKERDRKIADIIVSSSIILNYFDPLYVYLLTQRVLQR